MRAIKFVGEVVSAQRREPYLCQNSRSGERVKKTSALEQKMGEQTNV